MNMMCKTCREVKPRTAEFFYPTTYKRNSGETVHTFRRSCRACLTPAKRAAGRKSREDKPKHRMLYSSRHRAKKIGVDFNIDVTDIIIPDMCPLLDIPICMNNSVAQDDSASLDRIDPTKGYVKGNVWVISRRANGIKYNATADEILMVGNRLKAKVYEH